MYFWYNENRTHIPVANPGARKCLSLLLVNTGYHSYHILYTNTYTRMVLVLPFPLFLKSDISGSRLLEIYYKGHALRLSRPKKKENF